MVIRKLSDLTINQIAAGEVIENPASVVKELVENSIDAGSTSITIITSEGGRALIRIIDNGVGMSASDLKLSIERHATSKITSASDLIGTLGFRGEALPSIASVSKMSIHSSLGDKGNELVIEGSKLIDMQPKARARGTTIEVRALFYNVPVRRKFQKSLSSDVSAIHKCLTKIALCNSKIALRWVHDDKEQLLLEKDQPLEARIEALLGSSQEMLKLVDHPTIHGYISQPSCHRPNRTGQYLFINQRAVICPALAYQVLEGYGTRLGTHRYPLFVLHIELPLDVVDVNVHPQKKEIRLNEQDKIGRQVRHLVEKSLQTPPKIVPQAKLPEGGVFKIDTMDFSVTIDDDPELLPKMHHVLGLFEGYILAQEAEGVRFYDIAAMRYRIRFEEVMEAKIAQQALLLPEMLNVSHAEVRLIEERIETLNALGISIRLFGECTFMIDALPTFLDAKQAKNLIFEILQNKVSLKKEMAKALTKRLSKKLDSTHAASALISALEECQVTDTTPDGKKISFIMTPEDVASKLLSS